MVHNLDFKHHVNSVNSSSQIHTLGFHTTHGQDSHVVAWREDPNDGKYPLPAPAAYMEEIEKKVAVMAPPEFASQGEAAGKTRGRKKTKEAKSKPREKAPAKNRRKSTRGAAKAKAKAKAKSSRAKPIRSAASSAKAKAKSRAIPAPEVEEPTMSSSSNPKTERKRACSEQTTPSSSKPRGARKTKARGTAGEEPRIPPPHVTHNHIYSSAYRKALAAAPNDVPKARKLAHEAVEYFKMTGSVNELCGKFRSQPRKSRGATDVE